MSDPVIGAIDIATLCTIRAQEHLDAFARTRGYDDMRSLVSYAGDADPTFAAEGARGMALRSAMWAALRQVQIDVLSGQRSLPRSYEELRSEPGLLPTLTWE
jgi:hypothetical protein